MRGNLVFRIFIGVPALFAAIVVTAGDRGDRNRDDSYNVRAERILEGVIVGKGHIMEGLVYVPLKTAETVVEVQLGPKECVERGTFMFKPGDMVVVVGVPVVLNEQGIVVAREISGMKGTLVLRDDYGVRYTTATQSDRIR